MEEESESRYITDILPAYLSENSFFAFLPVEMIIVVHEGKHINYSLTFLSLPLNLEYIMHDHHNLISLLNSSSPSQHFLAYLLLTFILLSRSHQ